jgi:hypothetical protein
VSEDLPAREVEIDRDGGGVSDMLAGLSLRGVAEALGAGNMRLMAILR